MIGSLLDCFIIGMGAGMVVAMMALAGKWAFKLLLNIVMDEKR